jgi:5-methylcytosine-specific restriction protein A
MAGADPRSPEAQRYRLWYKTARWQKLRRAHLKAHPLCQMCADMGRTTQAAIVDHVRPHRGDEGLFFDPTNLSSLCPPHHDGTKQRLERGRMQVGLSADGWPKGS